MLNNKSAAELAADLFILIIKPIIVLQHTKKRPHYCTDALLNIQCHSKTPCFYLNGFPKKYTKVQYPSVAKVAPPYNVTNSVNIFVHLLSFRFHVCIYQPKSVITATQIAIPVAIL